LTDYETRLQAIKRYLAGEKPVDICYGLNRSKAWFFKWLKRYHENGEAGLKDESRRPLNCPNKTKPDTEKLIINTRKRLAAHATKETFYAPIGADSISWELEKLGIDKAPSIRTIDRILKRNGLVDNGLKPKTKYKIPYPAPDTNAPNDVHQLDPVGPRYIKGTNGVEKLFSINLVDSFSRMAVARQYEDTRNLTIAEFLIKDVWPKLGLSKILQVDNMLSIKGSNMYPRSPGMVIRLCLLLGIEVVFIPIREPQRNGAIESFNNTFDKMFFQRHDFLNFEHLKQEYLVFEDYYCNNRPHSKLTVSKQGARVPALVHMNHELKMLSSNFSLNDFKTKNQIKIPLAEGRISFIRFIGKNCKLDIFSEKLIVPESLKYCYVKATILTRENILQICHENVVVQESPYKLMD